jgi:hypothetical protein
MHEPIATFKAYSTEMIGTVIFDGLAQSGSGRDGELVSLKLYSFFNANQW